jgi:hypothetical protein
LHSIQSITKVIRISLLSLLVITGIMLTLLGKGAAYLMPAEQIIDLMTANFSDFKTLAITQSVFRLSSDAKETGMGPEQRLWLQAPDSFHLKGAAKLTAEDTVGDITRDMTYYRLLMENDKDTILMLLRGMGINLALVGFTRFEGIIVYRLGDKGTQEPKLLIEKERFLPIYFSYRVPGRWGTELAEVKFQNYRKVADGWYPYKIDYVAGERLGHRYVIQDLKVNDKVPLPLTRISKPSQIYQQSPKNSEDRDDENRIDSIIEELRKKHQ